jgi:hypothetical protein
MIDALHRLIPSLNSNKNVEKISDLCETTEMANLGSRQRMAGGRKTYQVPVCFVHKVQAFCYVLSSWWYVHTCTESSRISVMEQFLIQWYPRVNC